MECDILIGCEYCRCMDVNHVGCCGVCAWLERWMDGNLSKHCGVIPTLFGNFFGIQFHIEKGNKRVGSMCHLGRNLTTL